MRIQVAFSSEKKNPVHLFNHSLRSIENDRFIKKVELKE